MKSRAQDGSPSSDPQFLEEVFPSELQYVEDRWGRVYGAEQKQRPPAAEESAQPEPPELSADPTVKNGLVGLAFSGGGIRSATVNLGVSQALHERGVFKHADYMSTVSGGGYLGASISTAMRDGGGFPFEKLPTADESAYVTWLRNHSNYLVQGGLLDFLRLFAILLRGILLNFLVLVPLLLALAIVLALSFGGELTHWKAEHEKLEALSAQQEAGEELTAGETATLARGLPLKKAYRFTPIVAGLVLFWFLVYPVVIRVFKILQHGVSADTGNESSVKARNGYELTFARAIAIVVVVAGLETLPIVLHWFHHLRGEGVLRGLFASVAGGGSVIALTVIGRIMSKFAGVGQKLILVAVGLLGFILPLLLVLYVAEGLVYDWSHLDVSYSGWWIFVILLGLIVGGLLAAALAGRTKGLAGSHDVLRTRLVLGAFLVGLAAFPILLLRLRSQGGATGDAYDVITLLVAVLAAFAVATLVDKFVEEDAKVRWDGKVRTVLIVVTALVAGLAAYLLFPVLEVQDGTLGPGWLVLLLAGVLWMFTRLTLDVNLTGVLGLYRDRLASAYLVGIDTDSRRNLPVNQVRLDTIDIEEDLNLHKICGKQSVAPYHLVNTALNLQGSVDPGVRERHADFFFFSKNWIGGHRTGYCRSEVQEAVFPQMDLATAMAISAAAAAPNMGKGTSGGLVALMALLNVRLGYWVPNPRWLNEWARTVKDPTESTLGRRFTWMVPPRAFLHEMFSKLNETDKWVNLSDGGHLENMATYELLRRRCKYIITGDAEADGPQDFNGLSDLLRFARIDLGIEIDLNLNDVRLREGEDGRKYAKQHCAFGTIYYPPKHPGGEVEKGYLIYIKESVTGDEDETIRQYRAKSPTFPHESTADQNFSEGQFEAYRELGYHIADGLFRGDEHVDGYDDFERWFERQAQALAPS